MADSTLPVGKRRYRPAEEILRLNDALYELAKAHREAGDTKALLEVYQAIIRAQDVAVKWLGPKSPKAEAVKTAGAVGKVLKDEHRKRLEEVIKAQAQATPPILTDAALWDELGQPKFGRA